MLRGRLVQVTKLVVDDLDVFFQLSLLNWESKPTNDLSPKNVEMLDRSCSSGNINKPRTGQFLM